MLSTLLLESLPRTFTTAQYRDAAGLAASSASRALGALVDSGQVRSLGRGWWCRPFVGDEASRLLVAPPPVVWSPDFECMMDSVFGTGQRRLGYVTALSAAGIPATTGATVATTGRASTRIASTYMIHVHESAAVFAAASRRFTARTSISEPDRALLECAQFPRRAPRWEEHVGYAICWGEATFSPERVQSLADRFGWRAGLRRIASLAAGLARTEPVEDLAVWPNPGWAELDATPRRGDRWLSLTGLPASITHRFADTEKRVSWHTTPDGLAHELAT
ncbi:MAG: hypothetical protein KTV16_16080 [Acidimicrobiia bacterium]|nr:hypothetical protein [Acidimicrobiia bacterium]